MAIKEGDAKSLAEIIGQFVDNRNDKTINRTYKRGVVDSVTGNTASVFVDGSTVATKNILAIDSYKPLKGDKVLIVSIGDTGANLIILGSLDENTDWIPVTFKNSWSNYEASTGTWEQAAYRKVNGIVYVKGFVKGGSLTDGAPIFTLPEGFRPSSNKHQPTATSNGFGIVKVMKNGDIAVGSIAASAWFSIANISFPADG